jgi:hypothetical protein
MNVALGILSPTLMVMASSPWHWVKTPQIDVKGRRAKRA